MPDRRAAEARTPLGPRFWRLFASSAISNLGDGVGRTALILLAASLTRDPLRISMLSTLTFLPWLLFAIPSGALVDRMDRRRAMAAANVFRGCALGLLCLTIATGATTLALLYLAAFAIGVAETVYDSAARAMLPQVVGPEQLDSGNGWLTVEESVGQTFLGAPLGSILFAVVAVAPFAANAAGFLLAAVLVLGLRGHYRPARSTPTSMRTDIVDGVTWLWRHRLLRAFALLSGGTSLTSSMASGVLVLYVLQVLHVSAAAFGLVLTAAGVGGLIGGAVASRISARVGRARTLVLAAVAAAISEAAMGLTDQPLVGAMLFALTGMTVMVWNVLSMSLRQTLIPEELFGRVQGAYRTLVWGSIPIGSLLGGVLARAAGVPAVFLISGSVELLLAGALGRVLYRHRTELAAARPDPAGTPAGTADTGASTADTPTLDAAQ